MVVVLEIACHLGVTRQQHRFIPFQNYMCAINLRLLNNTIDKKIELGALTGGKLIIFGQQQEKACTLLKKIVPVSLQ